MKFCFIYDCIKNEILLETIKNIIPILYYEILFLSMTGSRMDFIRNYLKCYPKFILHFFIFIYECIKNEILLETIKNIISILYYEIIFLSVTISRMEFY